MADFLTIITLAEYLIMLVCQSFSIYFFGSILYWSFFRKFALGMNTSMHCYVFVEFIFSIACFIFCGYLSILWRPDKNIYDAYWIFATGSVVSVLLITQPLISCALGLDRCICLILPFKNTKLWNKVALLFIVLAITIFWALEIPFHVLVAWYSIHTPVTNCRSFSCLATTGSGQVYTTLRYITAISSVFIGITLIKLFNNKVTKQFSIKVAFQRIFIN